MITWTSVGLMGAAAIIAGQNLGAGHPERAIQGVHTAARIGLTVAAIIGFMFVVIPHALLWIFDAHVGDVAVIAVILLRFLRCPASSSLWRWCIPAVSRAPRHTQPAVHHTRLADCDPDWSLHDHSAHLTASAGRYLDCDRARPFARSVLSLIRFRQGKWRHIKVEVEGARA